MELHDGFDGGHVILDGCRIAPEYKLVTSAKDLAHGDQVYAYQYSEENEYNMLQTSRVLIQCPSMVVTISL